MKHFSTLGPNCPYKYMHRHEIIHKLTNFTIAGTSIQTLPSSFWILSHIKMAFFLTIPKNTLIFKGHVVPHEIVILVNLVPQSVRSCRQLYLKKLDSISRRGHHRQQGLDIPRLTRYRYLLCGFCLLPCRSSRHLQQSLTASVKYNIE